MVKEGYKETEIGIVPKDWEVILFGNCFKMLPNNTLSRSKLNDDIETVKNIHYGDILIRFNNILNCSNEKIPYMANVPKNVNPMLLKDGDIVIADTAEDETVGKTIEISYTNNQQIVSGLHTIPCRKTSPELFANGWLGYYMNHSMYHDQLLPLITGTKVSAISKSAIINTFILVPSYIEQQRIAEALSDMDSLISSLEKLIEKKKAIKQACLQKMFPKPGENVPEMRLPGFTEPWEQRKLGDISIISTGFPFDSKDFSEDGKYLVITNGNIQDEFPNVDGTVGNHISVIDDKILSDYLLDIGDILVTMDGTVGRTAKVSENRQILAQRVGRIKSLICSEFLYQWLNTGTFSNTMLGLSHVEQLSIYRLMRLVRLKHQFLPNKRNNY